MRAFQPVVVTLACLLLWGCGGDGGSDDSDQLPTRDVVVDDPDGNDDGDNDPSDDDPGDTVPATQIYSVMPPGNGDIVGKTAYGLGNQVDFYDLVDDPVADGTFSDADFPDYFKNSQFGVHTEVVFGQCFTASGEAPDRQRQQVDCPDSLLDGSVDLKNADAIVAALSQQQPPLALAVLWDEFAVPHVYAEASGDVAFGSGWATMQARPLVAEVVRTVGQTGLIELGAGSTAVLQDPLSILTEPGVDYEAEELANQFEYARQLDPENADLLINHIAEGYLAGLNQFMVENNDVFARLSQFGVVPEWRREHLTASAIMIGTMFGFGGGNEVRNGHALRALIDRFGEEAGLAMYRDLRMATADAVTHTEEERFRYPVVEGHKWVSDADYTVDMESVALLDDGLEGTLLPLDQSLLLQDKEVPSASNYLIVDGSRTSSGRPMLSGGPQTGYVAPELLFEVELYGGEDSYRSTGMTVPGLGVFVLVGHTPDYAWTITAGSSDIADQVVYPLCDPSGGPVTEESQSYLYGEECLAFVNTGGLPRTNHLDPLATETPEGLEPRRIRDPIVATGTVDGAPVAVAFRRASRGHEVEAAVSLMRLNFNEIKNASDFPEAMDEVPYSMNWGYLNRSEIAYMHTGRFPIRTDGVEPDLPTWGEPRWEWTGVLGWEDKPYVVNPAKGYLSSWNNKVAPNWNSADNSWGWGQYHRVVMLDDMLGDRTGLTLAEVFGITQEAATTDLRGHMVIPEVLDLLAGTVPPYPYLEGVRSVLLDWVESGSHRRDRNYDGWSDHPGVVLVDELVYTLTDAILDNNLGEVRNITPLGGVTDQPSSIGSAFQSGQSEYVLRALQRVGEGDQPGRIQCADGTLEGCQALMWQALDQAFWRAANDQPAQRVADIWSWRKSLLEERIQAIPGSSSRHEMRWQNRPTFHQVLSFPEATEAPGD